LLEPKWYPRFTLFGQFLGGIVVSLECLIRLNPVLLIESTGIPGAFPVFKLIGGAEVLVYMHYPTITPSKC
jgi:alpha-1,2-mannosyltransferase